MGLAGGARARCPCSGLDGDGAIRDRGRVLNSSSYFSLLRSLYKLSSRKHDPSPRFRGEREGPNPQGWEGEVGGATNRLVGPPHPPLSPRPAGGEGKGRVVRATIRRQISSKSRSLHFPRTAPRLPGGVGVRLSASVGRLRHQRRKRPRRWKTITIRLLFHGRGKPNSVEPEVGDVGGSCFSSPRSTRLTMSTRRSLARAWMPTCAPSRTTKPKALG